MTLTETRRPAHLETATMRATVFHGPNDIRVEEVPRPHAGPAKPSSASRMTTICGTDLHILKGEYPVRPGLVIGHEPVGVIDELGAGVTGYEVGERVLVGAITPCGQCRACLSGNLSQCGHGDGYEALGGWRFGNTIDGAQAEYLLVPSAQANLAPIPDGVTDEQVVLLADIASTGFSGAESGGVRIGDAVVVFAQGPIGLCATAGAKLMGASLVIGVDSDPVRLAMSQAHGRRRRARLHPGRRRRRGQATDRRRRRRDRSRRSAPRGPSRTRCAACGRAARCRASASTPGKLEMPYDAFAAGLGDHRIVTTLCPGGKERMRRLIATVESGRFDPLPLITHRFALDDIVEAYDLFGDRRDGVLKVAIQP